MNDLLSGSFSQYNNESPEHSIEMPKSSSTGGANLNRFYEEVESVKDELRDLESLFTKLQSSHEQSKTLHKANTIKNLRFTMETDISSSLKKAKQIKLHLESLDQSNIANRALLNCGPGSSSDRTRTNVVSGLRKKLHDTMNRFNQLRERIGTEYRETVQRRYYTVTGENPDEKILDRLIETGESETFMQKAIQEQGRGQVMDTIMEIQERHNAVKEMEKNLRELHQVFLDMAVLVQSQGAQLDDIESQVNRAHSFVKDGVQQLQVARKHQKNTRKWTCYGFLLLLIIALIIILSLRPWQW